MMTDPDTLRALAKKLCEAREGSRKLDAKVAMTVIPSLKESRSQGVAHWIHPILGPIFADHYTTSLDAALPGEDIEACHRLSNGQWRARDTGFLMGPPVIAHTEPLARRAAALLAMAERKERE